MHSTYVNAMKNRSIPIVFDSITRSNSLGVFWQSMRVDLQIICQRKIKITEQSST